MSSHAQTAPDEKGLERLLHGLFIAAAVVNLGANFIAGIGAPVGPNIPAPPEPTGLLFWLLSVSKSLLVPTLAGYFALSARGHVLNIRRGALYGALLFCWIGDVALLFNDFFLYGMAAFAIAHLCFIAAYSKGLQLDAALKGRILIFAMPVVTYGYMIYMTLYLNLPSGQESMALPLAGYMLVLLSNGMTCLLRALQVKLASSPYILLGVVLFIQSDSLIAMTRFVDALAFENFAIMLTYIIGLFLMVRGCLLDQAVPRQRPGLESVRLSA
ncbi:lysoplasmalogenase [Melittangium boletus]|uniref:Lysoplasmalogenase n=1 Tax=Melittangium boletus DSM 14713 TaxID=1294270 RepID=A0A250ILX7_9BACT|nr:lysoplasmalogenase [Melittangium boletus]ATB31956.1 hypothetical protein MEBOL_005428 [Melittangium boletus DSM 14713]